MGVSVDTTVGTHYTWETATVPWESPIAGRPWSSFAAYLYEVLAEEGMSVSAEKLFDLMKNHHAVFGVSEIRTSLIDHNTSETISVSENYIDLINFVISVTEVMSISANGRRDITKPLAESIGVSEANLRELHKQVSELMGIVDVPSREAFFNLVFDEILAIGEAQNREIDMSLEELFQVVEAYVRNANAVIGDIELRSGPMSFEEFKTLMSNYHPPGYTDWKQFVPGDHEYERALFEIKPVRAASDVDTELRLTGLRINADVPDIADRGGNSIPIDGDWVYFHRTFQNVPNNPEVTVNLKAGSELAIPVIEAIEYDRFFVKMVRISDGVSVAADITWSAEGF